eukprot:Skav231740  [mRNA]  locus=scaffold638:233244:233762:- [translate_table: standard]
MTPGGANLVTCFLTLVTSTAMDPEAMDLFKNFAALKEKPDPMWELKMPSQLRPLEGAFNHLDAESNVSFEDQAKEQVAALINSGKNLVEEVEDLSATKTFLARGQTCKRKCQKKMKKHLGNTCEHLEFKLQEAQKVDHAHLIESVKNALSVCQTSAKHHQEYCKWNCWREEL